jgi:hypothetical protein
VREYLLLALTGLLGGPRRRRVAAARQYASTHTPAGTLTLRRALVSLTSVLLAIRVEENDERDKNRPCRTNA